jgi:O-antigen/teichoic acid export membrane protein
MSENRAIARNSLILYIRLIITTVIGLYASRIVLLELGADNFGLYAIVGGIVSMLNVLNTTMISTSNRFIAIEIGKKTGNVLNKIFNTLLVVHIIFGLILLIFVEIAGVWYVRNFLNVDASKISDALFVLHLSTISAIIGTVIIPFQGLITAYEKFTVRASFEIAHSILNLGIVLLLVFHDGDKLRIYAVYVLSIQIIIASIYFIYSKLKYNEAVRWKLNRKKSDYIGISRFFGWQLVYVAGNVGSNQGGAMIINIFFGTVLNAAFGIASRVNEFVFSFVKNLNQAALPQIMKSYSGGNQERSLTLVYKLSKFTYFIMLIPAVPILLSIDTILVLWLKVVPPYTAAFVILRIIHGLISCLESGFDATIDATGRIRRTKIFFSFLFLSTLPVIYLLYKWGLPPYSITIIFIAAEIIFLLFQTRILASLTEFTFSKYFSITLTPAFFVSLLIIPQFFLRRFFDEGLISFLVVSLLSVLITLAIIYFVGLDKQERNIVISNVVKLPVIKNFIR